MSKSAVFYEYLVEIEDSGELKGFDEWVDARRFVLKKVWHAFHPFAVSFIRYSPDGSVETIWELEWTEPSMKVRSEDLQYFKQINAMCLRSLFKWA